MLLCVSFAYTRISYCFPFWRVVRFQVQLKGGVVSVHAVWKGWVLFFLYSNVVWLMGEMSVMVALMLRVLVVRLLVFVGVCRVAVGPVLSMVML